MLPDDPEAWLSGEVLDMNTFDKISFLSDQPRDSVAFLECFMETQIFASFLHTRTKMMLSETCVPTCFDKLLQAKRVDECEHPIPATPTLMGRKLAASFSSIRNNMPEAPMSPKAANNVIKRNEIDYTVAQPLTPPSLRKMHAFSASTDPKEPSSLKPPVLLPRSSRHIIDIDTGMAVEVKASSAIETDLDEIFNLPETPKASAAAKPCSPLTAPRSVSSINASLIAPPRKPLQQDHEISWKSNSLVRRSQKHREDPGRRPETVGRSIMQSVSRWQMNINTGTLDMQSHQEFIAALLDECAIKTKKIVLLNLGSDTARSLGHSVVLGFEDSLIASFCDMIERMCRHGSKFHRENSYLWKILEVASLRHLSPTVQQSIQAAKDLSSLKTNIGRARAFIRLLIERKDISSSLEEIISNEWTLHDCFKEHALFRNEEAREQVVTHLLSLSTVQTKCFSEVYPVFQTVYEITIRTSKKFMSGTSANIFFTAIGSKGTLGPFMRHKGSAFATSGIDNFEVPSPFIGSIKYVKVSHDNSGLSPAWILDSVTVEDKLLSKAYEFSCGSRIQADENTPEPSVTLQKRPTKNAFDSPQLTSMQRRSSISSMLSCSQVTILTASIVKEIDKMIEILASVVNKLIRFYYPLDQPTEADSTRSSDDEISREARRMLKSELSVDDCHTLAALLLGNDRTMSLLSSKYPSSFSFSADLDHHADDDSTCLVPALLSIFSFGFRAKMALGPKKHVWDFVHRAARQMTPGDLISDPATTLIATVAEANRLRWPKRVKFEYFVITGAKRKLLHVWFSLLCDASTKTNTHEQPNILQHEDRSAAVEAILRYMVDFSFVILDRLSYQVQADGDKIGSWIVA